METALKKLNVSEKSSLYFVGFVLSRDLGLELNS